MSTSTNQKIHRNSPLPLYQQLKHLILADVQSGRLVEGGMLPTERELQQEHKLSRDTVRHALAELEREGVVKRMQGVGTLVSPPKIKPQLMELTSVTEDMLARGLEPSSKTLDLALVIPSQVVQAKFELDSDEKIWFVKRLRLANDAPVGLNELYIPPVLEFSPRDLNTMQSYYELLYQRHGLEPIRAIETLTAKNANQDEANLLNIPVGSSLLVIDRVTYTKNDQPIEFVRIAYRADRYEYQVALYRQRGFYAELPIQAEPIKRDN